MIFEDDSMPYFLIVGSQRSGTTLMRLILDSHSKIQCHDESLAFRVFSRVADPICRCPLLGFKVPQITEQLAWPVLRYDNFYQKGGDSDLEMRNPYAGQKIIFMIRDARDTIASMLDLPDWLEGFSDPVLEFKITKDDEFRERYDREISYLRTLSSPRIARAALIWRYKVDAVFDYMQRGFPLLPVWYEALIASPGPELLRVCAFLQIPREDAILKHSASPHSELGRDGLAIGRTDPRRPIDSTSVGRWKVEFTQEQLREISQIVEPTQSILYP